MDRKQELLRIFLGLNALGHPLYREQISGSPQFLHMHDWPFCNHFSSWVFFFRANFGRCPVLKQYPFCSVAVGTFQPYPWKFRRGGSFSSNYTHDTYSTMCSGFRYLRHKQRDCIFFHRQSGGSRSGSPTASLKEWPVRMVSKPCVCNGSWSRALSGVPGGLMKVWPRTMLGMGWE